MTARALIALALVAACGGPTVSQPDAGPDAGVFDAPPELDAPLALDAPWIDAPPGVDAGSVACTAPPAAPGASAVVGPAGGTVAVGAAARLVIPAGALAAATTVTLRPVAIDLPSSQRALTAAYEVGPAGLAFAAPATLTFQLAATLPAIDDVTVRQGLAAGPFASVVTTRNGSAYTAAVPGATVAFAARVTAAAPATSTCAATAQPADNAYLFQNVAASGNYFTSYARATSAGFAVSATHQADSLWNLFGYGYTSTGAATGTINYTNNVVASIFGGHVVPAGSDVLIAYDSNLTMGSEVWVARKSATGAAVGAPVRVSQDPAVYSVEPQVAALPGGGAFVVWRAFDQPPGAYLRAAVLDASLAVVDRFDLTPVGAASAPGSFALVASAAGVGVAWQWASNTGNGVRYQGFTLAGCPATEVIEVGPVDDLARDRQRNAGRRSGRDRQRGQHRAGRVARAAGAHRGPDHRAARPQPSLRRGRADPRRHHRARRRLPGRRRQRARRHARLARRRPRSAQRPGGDRHHVRRLPADVDRRQYERRRRAGDLGRPDRRRDRARARAGGGVHALIG
ncbi:MAG: hypothetical protein IPH80_04705 [Myxococcales bacterium]|nr:hypothetical protein [Myxococcales bacterium]